VSMYTYKVAGPMILAEREVARRMCELAGFPDGDGLSMPGGSIANLVGMLCGRNRAVPHFKDEGADGRRLTFYLSTVGHYSVIKNAGVLGIGRNNVRLIDVDEQGRMRPDHLAEVVAKDVAEGAVPCAIIATAGTTVMGAFDPIREIAAVAVEHGIWLHVDGAFGGTMLLHPEHRKLLDGVELADSLTWDAHKAMGMPLMCSMLLTRDPEALNDNLNETADYLFQSDDDLVNPGTRSIQCGRANDTFKLWAAWQQLGDEGWAARIDRQMALSAYAVQRIQAEEHLHLATEPASTTICFTVDGIESPTVCEQLRAEGKAMVGYGMVFQENTVRLVTVNPEVTDADLDRLFDDILAIAAQHREAMAAPTRC
jgi:glutamate/tyrosine decarboxylase-like PLP-dependent enzyme